MNLKKIAKITGIVALVLLVIVVILVHIGRDVMVRKECHSTAWDSANEKRITTFDRDYNFYYEACMHSKGIK